VAAVTPATFHLTEIAVWWPTAWEQEVLEDFSAFTPMPIGSATIFARGKVTLVGLQAGIG
jgi:hypothetical protein